MEYKMLVGVPNKIQTWLNQWKHEYIITTLHMCKYVGDEIIVLITRKKKGE